MEIKKKICCYCEQPKYIWKRHLGKPYCKVCWSRKNPLKEPQQKFRPIKPGKPKKKISPRSEKRIIADKRYSKLRKKFLEEKPRCEAQLVGCAGTSCQVHHKKGRTGDLYLDVNFWLAICHQCHVWVENNPEEAKELGFSLNRL